MSTVVGARPEPPRADPDAGAAQELWHRREGPDRSQALRRVLQFAFVALNAWLGIEFWLFVRHYEVAGAPACSRPPGVEGWLPIAGLMNFKYWLSTGEIPHVHPAAMVLIVTFFVLSLLLRKAFCSWLCPVGTLSEWLWKLGRETFKRNFALPRWIDIILRSLKYILMGLFVWVVAKMPSSAIEEFLTSPYGIVADVKMLNFFRYMTVTTAVALGLLMLASVFVKNFWCRYLCPYGALMGLASLLSPLRIRRTPDLCIDCEKCAKACPSVLPVDRLVQIRSAECLGCMECVAVCPAEGALNMSVVKTRFRVEPWMIATACAALFLGIVGVAQATGHWQTPVPDWVYRELIPRTREFSHP